MKIYNKLIKEIFNYTGELVKHPNSTPNYEIWDTSIGGNDYKIRRVLNHDSRGYDVWFTRDGNYDKPLVHTPDASKIFSVAKSLIKEKLDQGYPVRVVGLPSRPELTNFYHRSLNALNQREYNNSLHVTRDNNTVHVTHNPLPNSAGEVKDVYGLDHFLTSKNPIDAEINFLLNYRSHLLNRNNTAHIVAGFPNLAGDVLRTNSDKLNDHTLSMALNSVHPLERHAYINHVLDYADPKQIGKNTKSFIKHFGSLNQIGNLSNLETEFHEPRPVTKRYMEPEPTKF